MVILGGLELAAAGYIIHKHRKNKREKQRLQEEEAALQQEQYQYQNPTPCRKQPREKQAYDGQRPSQQHYADTSHIPVANGRAPQTYPPTAWPHQQTSNPYPAASYLPPYDGPAYHQASQFPQPRSQKPRQQGAQQERYESRPSDTFPQMSAGGMGVYDPHRGASPHVRFAMPDGGRPGDWYDPPPEYRP